MRLVFNAHTRRKLGISKEAVEQSLLAQKARGDFAGWTRENLQENLQARGEVMVLLVAKDIRAKPENEPHWCAAQLAGNIDWEGLRDFIMGLIEMLMPLIVKNESDPQPLPALA